MADQQARWQRAKTLVKQLRQRWLTLQLPLLAIFLLPGIAVCYVFGLSLFWLVFAASAFVLAKLWLWCLSQLTRHIQARVFNFLRYRAFKIATVIIMVCIAAGLTQTTFGAPVFFPAGLVEKVRAFLLGDGNLSACDYKDGTILLIKPIATGAGQGRYEAGDIVEIRDGESLCERFGNGNFWDMRKEPGYCRFIMTGS